MEIFLLELSREWSYYELRNPTGLSQLFVNAGLKVSGKIVWIKLNLSLSSYGDVLMFSLIRLNSLGGLALIWG